MNRIAPTRSAWFSSRRVGVGCAVWSVGLLLGAASAAGAPITEIIHEGLVGPGGIAVDAGGNVYVTGGVSDNAFKITPAGVITEIIDATGDGAGNNLFSPAGIAVDAGGILRSGPDTRRHTIAPLPFMKRGQGEG